MPIPLRVLILEGSRGPSMANPLRASIPTTSATFSSSAAR